MAAGNSFGTLLRLTLFGESHGPAIGGILDGFPALREINFTLIEKMLQQRAPVQKHETKRKEKDAVEFLSGTDGKISLGSPLAFMIRNTDVRSADYKGLKNVFRPGHADFVYNRKYGIDPQSGGGRASGRETAARVVAGALALDFLRSQGVDIISYVSAIGSQSMMRAGSWFSEKAIFNNNLHCPDRNASLRMQDEIDKVLAIKNSIGGKITTVVKGLPAGVGEPVFGKINAVLSQAVMSIPGAKGVDFGEGFDGLSLKGSEYNDVPTSENKKISFASNHSGGIQAGISNGNDIVMNTVFRPSSSIGIQQNSVDLEGNETSILVSGRHDACYVPRAAIVVTAMAAVAIMDLWLQFKSSDRKY